MTTADPPPDTLLRTPDGSVRAVHDRHVEGLFSRDERLDVLRDVGLRARMVPFEHSEIAPGDAEGFVAWRPPDRSGT